MGSRPTARGYLPRIISNCLLKKPNGKLAFLEVKFSKKVSTLEITSSWKRLIDLKVTPIVGAAKTVSFSERGVSLNSIILVNSTYLGVNYVSKKAWQNLWDRSFRRSDSTISVSLIKNEEYLNDCIMKIQAGDRRVHVSGLFRECSRAPCVNPLDLNI
jgi:hypothetical protein